jgi:hypothetical protein
MPDGEPRSTPDVAETSFIRLAEAHRREGLVQDAIRICREGLQRFPASLRARIVLGQCLLDQGSIGEAIVELGRVEREGHDDPEVLVLLCGVRLGGTQPWPVGADLVASSKASSSGDQRSAEPAEPAVLILEPADQPASVESVSGEPRSDPLASATLAELYASQGEAAKADAILRQIAPAEAAEELEPPSAPEPSVATYLGELRRVREIAERLRKTQAR